VGDTQEAPAEAESPLVSLTASRSEGHFQLELVTGVPVVKVRGDIDVANAHALDAILEDAAKADNPAVVVDLADTAFLDSKAMQILLRLAERLGTNRRRLLIVAPRDGDTRRVLEVAGVTRALSAFDSLDEALAALAQGGGAQGGV
jgi:anti-anti-sigma factor